ncbi:hypothetical protein ABO04_08170 [Nitrosomonas sp. HPC101]|uniref:alginate O-acetyltransferase AlgX-related protein n=1 Tax=Nitrosomonas sp. HPC101 TaxID=1658667 RepID=UPI00136DC4FC|nr:hypothetical protein [Nitrosomonas sp. HPC101]MXS85881.1 hypothetical protein [Nitrosomonas sp. HPC101]
MKHGVFIFLSIALMGLLAVPGINILSAPNQATIKWKERTFLYNMDFISEWIARLLYPLGISTDPEQVIIGHEDWLFLGDQYEQTRTIDRRPPSRADFVLAKDISKATEAWSAYLSSKGVAVFKIMISPNKGTIYPEYLPNWAKPHTPNATDALLSETGTEHYVDLRSSLLAAKINQQAPLYYKTDTHWNALGAAIAFQAFAQQLKETAPEIQWPSQNAYKLKHIDPRGGGDLANFLRLTKQLSDSEPIIYASDLPIQTTQLDFDTKQIIYRGGNPRIQPSLKPVLIQSDGALNKKKVLWLRDSFGIAISPLISATFSEVLQLHWSEALRPNGRFADLVEKFKPDYVFLTVVERTARAPWFAAYPPPTLIPMKNGFKQTQSTIAVASNHLLSDHLNHKFRINGNDPFIDFALSNNINSSDVRYLNIDLTCDDNSSSVPVQLFWLGDERSSFDEENSTRFPLLTGKYLIDLRTIPKWSSTAVIRRIRLDIDAQNFCISFNLNSLSLGGEMNQ